MIQWVWENLSSTSSLASGLRKAYTNEWAIIPGEEYFLFRNVNQRSRSSRKTRSLQLNRISHEPEVLWMEQQVAKKRVKRDYRQRARRARPINENDLSFGEDEALVSKSRNRKQPDPNDPLWTDMWYLSIINGSSFQNRAEITGNSKMDHNVKEAWDLGYTGRGVVVTILDDGLERTHPDIAPNYDSRASYDVNDRDDDPMPRYEYSDENRHGTRCAGEVAAIFNNSLCIVGIAYNARIGGIRMLDGDVTDAVEAASLGHNSDYVDIYSASWGPDDDGRTVDGPAKLTRAAFERGIREGRRGKGSHIVIRAAKPINLRAGDWVTNGVGRNVSHSFGYGLMDAGAMVQLARNWTTAPEQHKCRQFYPSRFKTIPHGNRLQLQLYTDGCAGSVDEQVVYLEHVQAIITLKAPKRGDIQIYLTSPSGTRSTLLTKRARDTSRAGFIEWAFMTTHSWGELAAGLWTLEVDNDGWDDAELVKWDLVMFGTVDETTQFGGGHNSALTARSLTHQDDSRAGGSKLASVPILDRLTSILLPMLILLLRL
ncbi:unnamed protein product [Nippostrongylus brasiliensis]|uniref:Furin-like protease 1 (inferred by orthology to a D. melanogaster protein) n=1 Tax=Nippostrongylus brasiliensis TaxID=27835 RepID=A0A0N4YAJ8_NIPBR|nr:unnamed protein product [Nippostrongylus brasiliensis]